MERCKCAGPYYYSCYYRYNAEITDVGESVGVSVRVDDWQNVPVVLIDQSYSIGVTSPSQLPYTNCDTCNSSNP